ncbi:MAG: CDP-glycerol glycerophosphotransferase family protein [Lachnospiraceae bacterium]|nr:CDP-glycerol glycerophosphotransferase family protein [Lachnospiraceae bacterium]
MDVDFLFSVVMPVYNREKYLEDAIKSVLYQSCGISKIEIIMIDDGSTDGSGEICDKYQRKYPDHIKVVHQDNQGAAFARKKGVELASGKWINFLDSDDKLAKNVFHEVERFIRKHDKETDVIAFPVYFFGTRKGAHLLNYKFEQGSRVVDLEEEWQNPQLFINSAVMRAEVAKRVSFKDPVDIPTNEDAREMLRVLLEKKTLGLLSTTKYLYRRHEDTLVSNSKGNPKWYTDNLEQFSQYIMDYSYEKCGYVPKFVQFTVMYEFQWRLRQSKITENTLTQEEAEKYKQKLLSLCDRIDADVIYAQKQLWREQKSYLLYRRMGEYPHIAYDEEQNPIFEFGNLGVGNTINNTPVHLSFAELKNDVLTLEGWCSHYLYETQELPPLFLEIDGELHEVRVEEIPSGPHCLGENLYQKYSFYVQLPLKGRRKHRIKFILDFGGTKIQTEKLALGQFFPLDSHCRYSYKKYKNWILQKKDGELIVQKNTICLFHEIAYLLGIFVRNQRGSKKAILVRLLYGILSVLPHKEIWMVSDRILKADDNGEAFFKYLMDKKPKDLKVYFVISKNCADYERIKKIGPAVNTFSIKHRILHLLSTYNISSQGEKIVQHPFHGYEKAYRSLNLPRFVFLQHGVIKDDLSDWLNRRNKNLFGFITTSQREYDSIINGDYDYTEKQVWLTGLCRYDNLEDRREKIVAIVPTWRSYLLKGLNQFTGLHALKLGYLDSDFFQFYNRLINDKQLIETLKQFGYRLRFVPHPLMQPFINSFDKNDYVEFACADDSYRELFAKGSLLVTDYSSTAFDFAYLNKPVVYCQFDKEVFFGGNHTYKKGYFDYEKDGFGEVEYTLEATVDRIIEYVQNDCRMKPEYQKRVDETFAFHDKNNCERVYQKLLEMKSEI